MDHPIAILDPKQFPRKEPGNLSQELENALEWDSKHEFLRVIRNRNFYAVPTYSKLLFQVYHWDAREIGIAVFNGETRGIIDPEAEPPEVYQGATRLHFAAAMCSPKLTKYFLDRGDNVDVLCDFQHKIMNMKQATPLDLALESIANGYSCGYSVYIGAPWSTRKSIYELIVTLCRNCRPSLETVRLLVQKTSKRDVQQAFIKYANNRQLVQLSALFMAAPDLLLSYDDASLQGAFPSIGIPYLMLDSLEKGTYMDEALLLLLDVFTINGDKLVAYIRHEDYKISETDYKVVALLLKQVAEEVARRKPEVSSPDDYYLRFFKPLRLEADQLVENSRRNHLLDGEVVLSPPLKRTGITIDYINGIFRNKKPENAASVFEAIDNKLSSMSTFHRLFKSVNEMSMKEEKHLPQWFPFISSVILKPKVVTRTKPWINLEKKAMPQIELTSFTRFAKLSHFPQIVKRLIK